MFRCSVTTAILTALLTFAGAAPSQAQSQGGQSYVPEPLEETMLRHYRSLVRRAWRTDASLQGENKTQLKEITRLLVEEIYRKRQLRYLLRYEDPLKGTCLYATAKLRGQAELLRLELHSTDSSRDALEFSE